MHFELRHLHTPDCVSVSIALVIANLSIKKGASMRSWSWAPEPQDSCHGPFSTSQQQAILDLGKSHHRRTCMIGGGCQAARSIILTMSCCLQWLVLLRDNYKAARPIRPVCLRRLPTGLRKVQTDVEPASIPQGATQVCEMCARVRRLLLCR